jgi:hypothetical protein
MLKIIKLIFHHIKVEKLVEFLNDPKMLSLYKDISGDDYQKLLACSPQDRVKIDTLLQRRHDVTEAIEILTAVN